MNTDLHDREAFDHPNRHERRKAAATGRQSHRNQYDAPRLLVSDKHGAEALDISRASFWRLVGKGMLPGPVKLGGRTLWRYDELMMTVERLTAQRDGEV